MDHCKNGACEEAAMMLVHALNGEPRTFGCDLMEILYNGDVNNQDYFIGWWDQFSTKSAYLLSLITAGVAISGAYEEFDHPDEDAYLMVQARFTGELKTISKRIQDFSQKAIKEMYNTAKTNINRMLIEKDGKSNKEMA